MASAIIYTPAAKEPGDSFSNISIVTRSSLAYKSIKTWSPSFLSRLTKGRAAELTFSKGTGLHGIRGQGIAVGPDCCSCQLRPFPVPSDISRHPSESAKAGDKRERACFCSSGQCQDRASINQGDFLCGS